MSTYWAMGCQPNTESSGNLHAWKEEHEIMRCDLALGYRFKFNRLVVFQHSNHVFRIEQEYILEDDSLGNGVDRVSWEFDNSTDFFVQYSHTLFGNQESSLRLKSARLNKRFGLKSIQDAYKLSHILSGNQLIAEENHAVFSSRGGTYEPASLQVWRERDEAHHGKLLPRLVFFPKRGKTAGFLKMSLRPEIRITQTASSYDPLQIEDVTIKSLSLANGSYWDVYLDARPPIIYQSIIPPFVIVVQNYQREKTHHSYKIPSAHGKNPARTEMTTEETSHSFMLSFESLEVTLAFKTALKREIAIGETIIPIKEAQADQVGRPETSNQPSSSQEQAQPILRRRNSTDTMSTISMPPPPYKLT